MKKAKNNRKLSSKQDLFCRYYVIYNNAALSARKAGYAKKFSDKYGSHLLGKNRVRKRIDELARQTDNHLDVTAERVLGEFARIGLANMKDFAAWGPKGVTLEISQNLGDDKTAAVKEVSHKLGDSGEVKIKLHDKIKALESLADYLGLEKGAGKYDSDEENRNTIRFAYPLNDPKKKSNEPTDGTGSTVPRFRIGLEQTAHRLNRVLVHAQFKFQRCGVGK